ncbi:ste24 endopeptidase [Coraliomargarita sp. CAG:312]|nr:ste24 endopeptidase [Coraliomargarita sp. CAG:312]
MTIPVIVVLVMLAAKFIAATCLDILNMRSVRAHSGDIPESFKDFMDFDTYRKGISYTLDKTKFGIFESFCGLIFLSLVLALWILPKMFDLGMDAFGVSVFGQAVTLIAMAVVLSLPDLPFELYSQFVIEQEYGFNNSTIKLWIADKFKSLLVGLVLGAPILTLLLWFSESFKQTWWIWGFIAVAIFQILMIIVYPRFIIPLFNKLEDLPDGELKERLFDLADRGGFKARTIQVIDGSKRSSHSNAYFTGFGKFRRIVLFDTLIEQLDTPELEAVLAHEIGHYKKGHIVKIMAMSFAMTFLTFAIMGYLSNSEWFYLGFGFCEASGFGPVLLMYSLFAGAFTFWLTPIFNIFSRKNEYEADKFAASICGGSESLVSALRKLHKKNLGNLTPHPLYSAFYYSHPTLLERQEALLK